MYFINDRGLSENINPFHVIGLFLFPLKTPENHSVFDVFRGYRKRPVTRNGLITIQRELSHRDCILFCPSFKATYSTVYVF